MPDLTYERSVSPAGAERIRRGAPATGESLLCVALFPANTGYAWNFIESLYAGVADALISYGIATWVSYPAISAPPAPLNGSAARPVELRVRLDEWACIRATLRFIRENGVRVVYITDLPAWHPVYILYRLAGVRRIVVHDHTSGAGSAPRGVRRLLKAASRRIPGMVADEVLGVSDFVVQRKATADLIPERRLRRVWNSLAIPPRDKDARARIRSEFGVEANRPLVVCACRAVPEKGVVHVLRAFDALLSADRSSGPRPVLVYMGDGPGMDELRRERAGLACKDDVVFAGYRKDAAELLEGADICVVPSVWEEAFGLAALEPMARGVPVIASRIGGIPEVVVDGETGVLVPPGDEPALAGALARLLQDPAERARLGENGRRRAVESFSLAGEIKTLVDVLSLGFSRR